MPHAILAPSVRASLLMALLLAASLLQGCAYGLYDDQRLMETIADDKALSMSIKTALMKADFTGGWSVAVYCYYGNVFLIGEVPKDMQAKALRIARSYNPRSVTPHWFSAARSDTGDLALATSLRADLVSAKGLSSTRIDTEVNAGRVVLLGVVQDDAEKQLAIRVARHVQGVTSVTSYLMLPQTAHEPLAPPASPAQGNTGGSSIQERELPAGP